MIGNKFLSVAGASEPTDAQFNYVTMLLHGDGTNGAQNNTFLDSSPNNFLITRNGNTTQGSFSPYGSNWSNFFDGTTTTKLAFPSSSNYALGTGDFCIEAWVCGPAKSGYPRIMSIGPFYQDTNSTGLIFYDDDYAGKPTFYINSARLLISSVAITTGKWVHVAVTRSGTTFRMFVDGTQVATATSSASLSNTGSLPLYVGNVDSSQYISPIYGNISNLRVVKGSAVYTSAFTPSTEPLTSITNTVLLTCQSNRFKDNSSANAVPTIYNSPSVQRFNPFGTSTAYSTATIGGSGYFDGTTDSLASPQSATFNLSSGNWTIEGWFYSQSTLSGSARYFVIYPSSGAIYGVIDGSGSISLNNFGFSNLITGTIASSYNAWQHVALVKNGSTTTLYVNGVVSGSANVSWINADSTIFFGGNTGSYAYSFLGNITDARVVIGTAVYTAAFTPPSAPLTAISNTALLLNMTNAGIVDNAMMNDLETVGNAQISTSVKKYGTGSMYFDGATSTRLAAASNPSFAFGTGAYTVEAWIYATSYASVQGTIFDAGVATGSFDFTLRNSGALAIGAYGGGGSSVVTASSAVGLNQWVHVAAVRSSTASNDTRIFVNGVLSVTGTDANNYTVTTFPSVGSLNLSGYTFVGYIDDLRITKGYARYTANFTPPTSALADKSSS